MTIPAYTPANHLANGATTVWSYTFLIPEGEAELAVYDPATFTETIIDPLLYSIAGEDDPAGGTITYPLSGTAVASPNEIIIRRRVDETQTFDPSSQNNYDPVTLMNALDRIEMQIQQLRGVKQLRVPEGDATDPEDLVAYILTMIEAGISGGVYQPLDADLTAIAALATTAYGRAFLALANAAAARTALELVGTTTDNAVIRADGTGGKTQNSAFIVDDSGHVSSFGGNIKFPATQVASADANTLDDYEEGTWTPTLEFGGASTGITYDSRTGAYTKIGRMVFANMIIDLSSKGSATGTATVTGLPFATAVAGGGAFAVNSGGYNSLTAGLVWTMNAGDSSISVLRPTTTGASSASDTQFENSSILRTAIMYSV